MEHAECRLVRMNASMVMAIQAVDEMGYGSRNDNAIRRQSRLSKQWLDVVCYVFLTLEGFYGIVWLDRKATVGVRSAGGRQLTTLMAALRCKDVLRLSLVLIFGIMWRSTCGLWHIADLLVTQLLLTSCYCKGSNQIIKYCSRVF